jgi:hypothetical protein
MPSGRCRPSKWQLKEVNRNLPRVRGKFRLKPLRGETCPQRPSILHDYNLLQPLCGEVFV